MKETKAGPAGLWTSPNEQEAPPGALRIAENVIIRRKGIAQPRPGFDSTSGISSAQSGDAVRLRDFNQLGTSEVLVISTDATNWDDEDPLRDESAAELVWQSALTRPDSWWAVQARENLYLTTVDTIRKAEAPGASVAYRAGAARPEITLASSSATAIIPASYYRAYRAVLRRKDSNGLVVRSAPSGRLLYQAGSGAAAQAQVNVTWDSQEIVRAGDVIELYATTIAPTQPLEEYYLAYEFKLTSTEIAAKFYTFTDARLDADLGATLYTSDSQEGAEGTHDEIPCAGSMALFQGSLFLADLTYRHYLDLIYDQLQVEISTSQATGIGRRDKTGTLTNGSADITSISNTTGLQIGQILTSPTNFNGSAPTRITNISGTTVTLSRTWAGSTGSNTVIFHDAIWVKDGSGTEYYTVEEPAYDITKNSLLVSGLRLTEAYFQSSADVTEGRTFIRLRRPSANQGAFEVFATHGDEYYPPVPLPTASNGTSSSQDTYPAGLAWSNNREPEHFRLGNFDLIGGSGRALALVPTQSALLVFKADGAWKVSGEGAESGFRFDELDQDVRVLNGDAVAYLDGKAYPWGDKGIYQVTADGAQLISLPIRDSLEPLQQAVRADSSGSAGVWACANRKDNEVLFGLPFPAVGAVPGEAGSTERILVWNAETGAFSHWFPSTASHLYSRHACESAGFLMLAGPVEVMLLEKASNVLDANADAVTSITISAVSGGTAVTINASSWTPAVGDTVIRAGVAFSVVSIVDATHFSVNSTITTGGATAWKAFSSVLAPIAAAGMDPGSTKTWGEGCLQFESTEGLYQVTLAFSSNLSGAEESQAKILSSSVIADSRPGAYRFTVPRNHARCTKLLPKLTILQGGSKWALDAIALKFWGGTERVHPRR